MTMLDLTAEVLCQLCHSRQATTAIGSLWPNGLDGECYGPYRVCVVCSRQPPEKLYELALVRPDCR